MKRWKKLLYAIFLWLILLGGIEIGARLKWTEKDVIFFEANRIYVDHPTWFWILRPSTLQKEGRVQVQSNTWGFRSPEFSIKKEGIKRVLFMGESSTMGTGVEQQQTYAYQAGALLAGQGWDFFNAGIGAWTIWQSRTFLLEEGSTIQPDLVVLYHQHNDFLPTQVRDAHHYLYEVRVTDRQLYERRKPIAPFLGLLFHSRAYLGFRKQVLLSSSQDLPIFSGGPQGNTGGRRVPDEDRKLALQQILEKCTELHAQLMIVLPHYGADFSRDHVLQDFSRAHQLPLVDIAAHMREEQTPEPFLLDGVHPTPAGHADIARWIIAAIP